MSFVAGLLGRERPAISRGTGASAASAGTTAGLAVLPRLASRYEEAGAPLWPGNAAPLLESETETGSEAGPDPSRTSVIAPAPAVQPGAVPSISRPAARSEDGPALRPAPVAPGSRGYPQPAVPAKEREDATTQRLGVAAPPAPAPAVRPVLRPKERPAPEPAEPRRSERVAAAPGRPDGVVRGEAVTPPAPTQAAHARREPATLEARATGTLRPRLEPLMRREAVRAPEQHVHVHIGRIEVKAATVPAPRAAAPERPALMSLDEYLADRP
ncbi:hypothetical protein AL755_14980 [Arthrobacter sp. ERGS1:01]|uniref:hypothetical protein n=1 Tax=Arthrobacter sp. ERGS1:01 TaxID=1704044 RepID=UPI0006B43834|nr:hypothetical protein [Arthrobacter sp. ERGS1:01]ALE06459.1 hypothetical protein AL755_14980 [Arthrobacter sp. ERGS1:01]